MELSDRQSGRQPLSQFAKRLLSSWRALHLPAKEGTIVLAVSGGADSSALLLAVAELIAKQKLNVKVVIAHLDHGLRKESRRDARFVRDLASKFDFDFVTSRVDMARRAAETGDNLEQAARRARYEFLGRTAKRRKSNFVITAHTLDDQAETVMLRLLRGSGADGIAGIEPTRPLQPNSEITLARPLLSWARREDTERYCREKRLEFLSDPMNEDEDFARVRVRRQLLPLMASFNSKIVETLGRTSELLRGEVHVLDREAAGLLQLALVNGKKGETNLPSLDVKVLAAAPVATRRRALRQWIELGRGDLRRCQLAHIVAIERLLVGEQGGRVAELPDGMRILRRQSRIELKLNSARFRRNSKDQS